jgi:hypothetical protein
MPHIRIKKSPVTRPGIDPGTVRLVAQRLNHYATPTSILVAVVNTEQPETPRTAGIKAAEIILGLSSTNCA